MKYNPRRSVRSWLVGTSNLAHDGDPSNTAPTVSQRERAWRRIAWGFVAVALIAGAASGLYRAGNDRPDWGDLAAESRYTWQHEQTANDTAMFGYLPTTTFALWPFTTWLDWPIGPALFVLSNVAAAVASIWIVQRWWLGQGSGGAVVWAAALVAVNFAHAIQANQTTMWTLVLVVGGLALVECKWGFAGGVVLGLAMLLKTIPVLLIGYVILRRRWRAIPGILFAVIVFDLSPSVTFFGLERAVDEHHAWLQRAEWHSNSRQIWDPLLRVHRHGSNSSYSAVLTRWLRARPDADRQVILYGDPPADVIAYYRAGLAPDEVLSLDPMPPRSGAAWREKRVNIDWVPRFHVVDWPAAAVYGLWAVTLVAGFAWLAWLTGRSVGRQEDWTPIAALWLLAMFWPSPMARHYYLAWAFPAIAVVVGQLRHGAVLYAGRMLRSYWLPIAALVVWGVGVAGLGWRVGRWYGLPLLTVLVLMAAVARARTRRLLVDDGASAEEQAVP